MALSSTRVARVMPVCTSSPASTWMSSTRPEKGALTRWLAMLSWMSARCSYRSSRSTSYSSISSSASEESST